MYRFDPDTHTYYAGAEVWPSVTQALPSREYRNCEYQRDRGKYAHRAIELYLSGDLDEDTLDPALVPYLTAFKVAEYFNLTGVIDLKTGSKTPTIPLQIAAYILLANEGVKADGTRPDIIEIEEPLFHPVYRFAGTPDLIITDKYPIVKGAALFLKGTGKPQFEDYSANLRHNRGMFLSFLNTYYFKKENNLL